MDDLVTPQWLTMVSLLASMGIILMGLVYMVVTLSGWRCSLAKLGLALAHSAVDKRIGIWHQKFTVRAGATAPD